MSKLKTIKFQDLYEMSSGISSKPEQAGHGTPFLSFSTVFNNYFIPDQLPDLMSISDKEKKVYSIKKGDIFLTRTSETLDELGMSSVAVKDYPNASYSGFLKRLRPKNTDIVYPKYLAFYLRSKLFRKTMNNNAIMTLRASLNEQIFSYLDLILPEYGEQKKIGDLLFCLNQKIELNKRINAELEAMAKTLYDYWFVQFEFPFDFTQGKPNSEGKPYKSSGGKMVWNEELKREIPEGWEVRKIDEVAIIKAGGDKPETFSIEKTKLNNIPIYSNGITNDGLYGYTNKPIINDQSVTISARGTIGFCVLRNKPFVPIIRLIALTPNFAGSAKYFFEVLKSFNFENSGSVQQQLTVPQVKNIKLLYPNEDLLKKFDKITFPMISKIETIKEENQHLSSLRDWLLPMLMNGQVTVNEQLGVKYEQFAKRDEGTSGLMAAEDGVGYGT